MLLLIAIVIGGVIGFFMGGLLGALLGVIIGAVGGLILFAIIGILMPSGAPKQVVKLCSTSFVKENRLTAETAYPNKNEQQLIEISEKTIHSIFKRARAIAPTTATLAQSFSRLNIKQAATEMMRETKDVTRMLFLDSLEKHIEKEMYPEPKGDPSFREAMDKELGLGHHPEN